VNIKITRLYIRVDAIAIVMTEPTTLCS
jgi:hypothetical protein